MTRVVIFSGEQAAQRFELIYEGFLMGQPPARGADRPGGFADVRLEAQLLQRLKAISMEKAPDVADGPPPVFASGDRVRTLASAAPVSLLLTVPQLELLRRYFEATRWTARHAIDVVDVADLLISAPEVDDEAK